MGERLDPVIQLTIEGKGWDGDEWNSKSGEPGTVVIYPENTREAVESLRRYLAERLTYNVAVVATLAGEMDFKVPNLPEEASVRNLVEMLERTTETARCLHQLSPWDYNDEDDDEEPEPEPDPSAARGASGA